MAVEDDLDTVVREHTFQCERPIEEPVAHGTASLRSG
jgi:hypothetical protein